MIIGERLRQLRLEKGLSQGDIEAKTHLLRCYLSRCENGHTTPSVQTLEKWAGALEVPLYRLFHDGPVAKSLSFNDSKPESTKDTADIKQLRKLLAKMSEKNQSLLLRIAATMARKNAKRVHGDEK